MLCIIIAKGMLMPKGMFLKTDKYTFITLKYKLFRAKYTLFMGMERVITGVD
jgi:hypothetical protein